MHYSFFPSQQLLLLLCLSCACLPRPSAIEQPMREEPPQGRGDSGKVVGNPLVVTEEPCMLNPSGCEPLILPAPNQAENPPSTNNQTNPDNPGGNTPLIADTPELSDDMGLDAVRLKAECENCLHPSVSNEVELHCEVVGCSGSFNFVTSTSRPQRNYTQALCGSSGKTMRDLMSLKLVCQFRQTRTWWWDYKRDAEINLSKALVEAQHLCVVTADSLVPSGGGDVFEKALQPEPTIEQINCNHSSMWSSDHKLSLSFSW